ncbi:MAG: DUF2806 domain-containing protein [Acidobacteriota bacterium]|nr:DUF2806 domain-containing protein [Acidobacteriota bacterium]
MTEEFIESQKLLPSIEYKDGQLSIPSKSENESSLQQRYKHRSEYQQARKQLNIENVTANAVEELRSDPNVENYTNNEPVDADWISRFFQTVENVSDEQMQQLWGRILAGEVKKPKSFSFRTLETLRNLSKAEAKSFSKICEFAFSMPRIGLYIPDFSLNNAQDLEFSIPYNELLLMKELGFLQSQGSAFKMYSHSGFYRCVASMSGYVIELNFNTDSNKKSLFVQGFTQVGKDLFPLIDTKQDGNYLKKIFAPFFENCSEVTYGKIGSYIGETPIASGDKMEILYSKE